jgi:hypothetical protein
MRRRIYTDTSVIGGCLDAEFEEASRQLLDMFKMGEAILVLSDLTLVELQEAPAAVRAVLEEVSEAHREYVELTEEAAVLAQRYIDVGVIGAAKRVDAQYIAVATISRVEVLVSWNFRHIVNLQRIRGYNSVNLRHGYPLLEIRTPQEVIHLKKNKKSFDAVHMMRQLRDSLSEQCKDMTFEEQKQYIRERLSSKPPQERPRARRSQPIAPNRA